MNKKEIRKKKIEAQIRNSELFVKQVQLGITDIEPFDMVLCLRIWLYDIIQEEPLPEVLEYYKEKYNLR